LNLPLGYKYAATYAGIRNAQKDDIALIVSNHPASAAAVFTTNMVQAAPIRLARKHLESSRGKVSALLVNAGNANCATRTGDEVALASTKAVAKSLGTRAQYVLPASTGVIGVELDSKLLIAAIPTLAANLSVHAFKSVAQAILTTDTRLKIATEELQLSQRAIHVAGMTKGSGMIQPNMATTLGFVMTDALLSPNELRGMLSKGISNSYNSLTVDGDMSTNDIVVLLANGASGVRLASKEKNLVGAAIKSVLESLAKQIAADGEGARKLIIVNVEGFSTTEDARKVARSISNSPLVKTAIAGSDPNWGRILAAAGYSGVTFNPKDIDVYLQDTEVCRRGLASPIDELQLKKKLGSPEVHIRLIQRGRGKAYARFFTCDLTEGYIQINGSYRT
jgi:glutamate N-acetyltransferase/amino-acid N-acetyltransferase